MKKFEYKEKWCDSLAELKKELNKLGQEGWEAYYIYMPQPISFSIAVTAYMKREIVMNEKEFIKKHYLGDEKFKI